MGIQFAINYQGVDQWFREIHHIEFKFPYHTTLWPDLDGMAFYGASGLPNAGNIFKMSFSNNDDDIQGPDGANPNVTTSSTWRVDPFFMQEPTGHDHWSDMKYYPAFKYEARTISKVHITSGEKKYGDPRIAGLWVDAATEKTRYPFGGGGAVTINNVPYFYGSSGTGTPSGRFYNQSDVEQGTYQITLSSKSAFRDTLRVTIGATQLTLLRFAGELYTQALRISVGRAAVV